MVKLSTGNGKLAKEGIASFNIPALKDSTGFTTCPNAGICAGLCYARQGRYHTPSVQAPREANVALLRDCEANGDYMPFIDAMHTALYELPKRFKRVRIHDSGDFFSAAYFEAWLDIVADSPAYEFYAYTKMIELVSAYDLPANLHIVQSVGGLQDDAIDTSRPHSRIFASSEALLAAGYVDGTKSDAPAYGGEVRIGLVYHGTRKLTGRQFDILS